MKRSRFEELRRRLLALKYDRESATVQKKMDELKKSPVPNIMLFRLLELEQSHLVAMNNLLKLHELSSLKYPNKTYGIQYQPRSADNDNILRKVKLD